MLVPAFAFAEDAAEPVLSAGDTAWMLTSTALVLLMTIPGLSLFYAGMVRSKNALSVMMQCFVITCLITVLWVVYLYSLAFGDDVGGIIGNLAKAFHNGVTFDTLKGTIPESVFSTFQLTFAIITPGADRRCVRRTDEVLRADLVHGTLGHAWSMHRSHIGSGAAAGSARWAYSISQAEPSCTSTRASPVWSPHW